MYDYMTVRNYYPERALSKERFVARYPHPFLVMIGMSNEIDSSMAEPFYNTVVSVPNQQELAAISKGRMLAPEAIVFRVTKRTNANAAPGNGRSASVVMVGRAHNADVVIPAGVVSKSHFYIAPRPFKEDEFTLSDNGSTNGTKINDEEVPRHTTHPLRSGDKITLGSDVVLRFLHAADFFDKLQLPTAANRDSTPTSKR
jgi:hypothetical protein